MSEEKDFSVVNLNQEHLERLYTPDIDPLFKRGIEREIRKLIIVNVTKFLACLTILVIHIDFKLPLQHKKDESGKLSHSMFGMCLLIFGILNAMFDLLLAIYEHVRQQHQQDKIVQYQRWDYVHLITNIIGFIVFSIFLILEFISCSSSVQQTTQLCSTAQLTRILLLLLLVIGYALCVIWSPFLVWNPKYRFSGVVLFFSSTILICISIVAFILNGRMHSSRFITTATRRIPLWCYKTSQFSASYTIFVGIFGIILTFIYGKGNQPNKYRDRIRYFFNFACVVGITIVVTFTFIHRVYDKIPDENRILTHVKNIIHADRVLSILRCFLMILQIKSIHNLRKLQRFNQNKLKAERIQLSKQSPAYIKYLGAAIDEFSQTPDGMTGHAALQLMVAYEEGQLENISSIILRINRVDRQIETLIDDSDDMEAIVLLTVIHKYDTTVSALPQSRLSRLLSLTLGSQNWIPFFRPFVLQLGLLGYQWPFRTGIFYTKCNNDYVSHSAEILRSIIEWNEMQHSDLHCDVLLLPSLSTEPVAKAIRSGGFIPIDIPPTHILDLRPHHGKTWKEYVKTLKRTNRRPYLERFLEQGGVIEEIHDLNRAEVGAMVCHQWDYIAQFRHERNEPHTLAKPNIQFIASLSNSMIEAYRSVLFLRLNNEVIASSVIFRFPNKLLTTDIHGNNHEKSRPVKGYFVMLQWTIKEALEKKFDFIDFGPTTPGPKMDLGSRQVSMQGAAYCGNPIVSYCIKKICRRVDIVHMKKDNSKDNSIQETTNKQNTGESQVKFSTKEASNAVASVHKCQVSSNGSYVVEAEESEQRQVSATATAMSKLDELNRSMSNNTCQIVLNKNEIESANKDMLPSSNNTKSKKKKKKSESNTNNQSSKSSPLTNNDTVVIETTYHKASSPNINISTEHLESNIQVSTVTPHQHLNGNPAINTNQIKSNNDYMLDQNLSNMKKIPLIQQHYTTTNLNTTTRENTLINDVTPLIPLSIVIHNSEML